MARKRGRGRGHTVRVGGSEIRLIKDLGRNVRRERATSDGNVTSKEAVVIPGGSYKPGEFPALERFKRQWRDLQ